jgi:hypothetical protein
MDISLQTTKFLSYFFIIRQSDIVDLDHLFIISF